MTNTASILLHSAALAAMALGLWAWDAQGAGIWSDAIFSFCL